MCYRQVGAQPWQFPASRATISLTKRRDLPIFTLRESDSGNYYHSVEKYC
jgi:hypothetical protein